jgi:hypothetical protein
MSGSISKRMLGALAASLIAAPSVSLGGPIDVALDPAPQEFTDTCQSYSLALAMSFQPSSPYKANTPTELRELERRVRQAMLDSASQNGRTEPVRDDWKAAVESVASSALTVRWQSFSNLDAASHFIADKTGISSASSLGAGLSVALIQTPVIISFTRIAGSQYATSHIVTVFGIDLPPATLADTAHPPMLLVNSAVKFAGGRKNICANEALSDHDPYRAVAALTDDYDLKLFSPPYLVTWVDTP